MFNNQRRTLFYLWRILRIVLLHLLFSMPVRRFRCCMDNKRISCKKYVDNTWKMNG